jgi:hypothetical protein
LFTALFAVSGAWAHHPDGGGDEHPHLGPLQPAGDPGNRLAIHDAATAGMTSTVPDAEVKKNLDVVGRGIRLEQDATTDVWAHGRYAYTGTFNSPCGGEPNAGVFIWDVHNKNNVFQAGLIPSPVGSRSNDVKVATINAGDILVHSNESCGGGPGGFEIYNVDDPANPQFLASVQTDDVNLFLQSAFGFVDFGVHNLFLFTQGTKDYVAVVVESLLGNFQIFDITDPTSPQLVGFWGAEQLILPGVDWVNTTDFRGVILPANAYFNSGVGASANRFLHAGLVLLDISDPTSPQLVSAAIDVASGSLDGEVNSHAAWPSEDGAVVVESEEDFDAWEGTIPPGNLTMDSSFPGDPVIPGTTISTLAGDDFEGYQTGNFGSTDGTSVGVASGPLAGNVYPAVELSTAAGSPTFADTGTLSGELVWIGRACATSQGDAILNAGAFDPGDIAVVRRGACFFEEKADTAATLGASAVIIANNQSSTPWGGIRIWDYSDPTNPLLASTVNTVCSASTEPGGDCDPRGTYSVHNIIVETDEEDERTKAYISWYSDGVLVLDITDPYNPVETARYHEAGPAFELENGGIQDVWGIYKVTTEPWVYASDRNGGLYILKEFGGGSGK